MKKVGYAFYVHKSNLNELFNAVSEEERNHIVYVIDIAKLYLFLEFDIVKYDTKLYTPFIHILTRQELILHCYFIPKNFKLKRCECRVECISKKLLNFSIFNYL